MKNCKITHFGIVWPTKLTHTSKEGLSAVLFQKQDDGCYHPITLGSHFHGVSKSTSRSTLSMHHSWCRLTTTHWPMSLPPPALMPLGIGGLTHWPLLNSPWSTRRVPSVMTMRQSDPHWKVLL